MKIYFLPSYRERAPSTRMRVYKPAAWLQVRGVDLEILDHHLPVKRKHALLENIREEDILYVQKWRTDFNNVEHIGQYKGKCKIVFDMDDHTEDPQALELIEVADYLIVGNHRLYDMYHDKKPTSIVPTPVDLTEFPRWTGEDTGTKSISIAKCGIKPMLRRLKGMSSTFEELSKYYRFRLVLAGFEDSSSVKDFRKAITCVRSKCMRLKAYDEYLSETVPVLQRATMGILPFTAKDNGKSGHSLLANMAMGIPTIASPYAECDYIIHHGVNGFLVKEDKEDPFFDDWYQKIITLFEDHDLRQQFRYEGWKTIIDHYDVPVVAKKLRTILESL